MTAQTMAVPSGSTRVAGLVGYPGRYSLSPLLHNAAYKAMGFDGLYVVFAVQPQFIAEAVASVKALELLGVSVTHPHKEAVVTLCDELGGSARVLEAVNTIVVEDGRLVGHNTDGQGFVDSLVHESGYSLSGKKCLVAGAGGAARAVIAALAESGVAEVVVVNRSEERAQDAARLAKTAGRVGSQKDIAGADLIVNATPVGMVGDLHARCPIDPSDLHEGQLVADLVYEPERTRLLVEAERRGAQVVSGLGMLVHQAAAQIELWTGQVAPVDVMRAALEDR